MHRFNQTPNLLLVGGPKTGTTSLMHWLRAHNSIFHRVDGSDLMSRIPSMEHMALVSVKGRRDLRVFQTTRSGVRVWKISHVALDRGLYEGDCTAWPNDGSFTSMS